MSQRILLIVVSIFVAVICLCIVTGCTDQRVQEWIAARDAARAELEAAKETIATLQREAAALPEGPARDKTVQVLVEAEKLAAILPGKIDALDRAITAAQAGNAGEVGAAAGSLLTGLPVIGPYAGIVGALVGIGWGLVQRARRRREAAAAAEDLAALRDQTRRIVSSVDAAVPTRTEEQKTLMRAVQGPDATALVDQLKG